MVTTEIPVHVFEDLRITSYHEAGHAVLRAAAGYIFEKITIERRIHTIGKCSQTTLAPE